MKTLLKVLGGLVALAMIAVVLVFYFTSGITDTADEFFNAIKAKQYPKAYLLLSENFRATTSQEEFVAFLNKNDLLRYKGGSWSNRSISGGKGELDGSITTETGGTIPIKLSFVKEGGKWKIYALQKPKTGLVTDALSGDLPSGSDQIALVRETMRRFAQAINAKDFRDFHSYVSHLWQQQITAQEFARIFKAFIDAEINLLFLENYLPVFEEVASLSQDGVLTIRGYYPTKPSKVLFEFGYIHEGMDWKLVKTNINIKPVE